MILSLSQLPVFHSISLGDFLRIKKMLSRKFLGRRIALRIAVAVPCMLLFSLFVAPLIPLHHAYSANILAMLIILSIVDVVLLNTVVKWYIDTMGISQLLLLVEHVDAPVTDSPPP